MKRYIISLILLIATTIQAGAMSYQQAREQALFLTDKMAYELNLNDQQYDAVYEINLDYLMGVNTVDDLYDISWRRRNTDLQYVLLDWQWSSYVAASYFYRPLYWDRAGWHFGIYAHYPRRDFFYFSRPSIYLSYRGGHSWHHNGGRSWYEPRVHTWRATAHHGMRDRHMADHRLSGPRHDARPEPRHDARIDNRNTRDNRYDSRNDRPYGHGNMTSRTTSRNSDFDQRNDRNNQRTMDRNNTQREQRTMDRNNNQREQRTMDRNSDQRSTSRPSSTRTTVDRTRTADRTSSSRSGFERTRVNTQRTQPSTQQRSESRTARQFNSGTTRSSAGTSTRTAPASSGNSNNSATFSRRGNGAR